MIAVDVMGGDYAPSAVLQGSVCAAKKSISLVLYGPEQLIYQWLEEHEPEWNNYPITIVDASQVIAMDEDPVRSVRRKRNSSLVKAIKGVEQGVCTAIVSAGNSGALMAAASLIIGRSDGVERPAIAGFLSTVKGGQVLVLDLGANTQCRPIHLHQFAQMGSRFLQLKNGIESPRVGLLSNGQEKGKGPIFVKEAFDLLIKDNSLNFIGNVEPYGVFKHRADVVVCDGFSGNIFLKTMEAVGDLFGECFTKTEKGNILSRLSWKKCGGALLLGVKKPVIVCHGNSNSNTIEKAIMFASNNSYRK